MRKILLTLVASAFVAQALDADDQAFKDWYKNWNVKQGVSNAQVVLVARVTHVGKIKVVEGAKTNQYFREFKFQPLKVLKGVFSRDELTMSASDLGCRSAIGVDAKDIKEDQIRVLLLSQSNPFGSSYGCAGIASSANIRQSIPIVSGLDDPIVTMFETIIKVDNMRSRQQRSRMLVDAIKKSRGPALVPLMQAIRNDLIWATADKDFGFSLISSCLSKDKIIREFSFGLLCDSCRWQNPKSNPGVVRGFDNTLKTFLTGTEQQTLTNRLRAFRAAIHLEKISRSPWLEKEILQIAFDGRTYQERRLGIETLGELRSKKSLKALAEKFKSMPLDANDVDKQLLTNALHKIDAKATFELTKARIKESLAYGIPPFAELRYVANLDDKDSEVFLLGMLENPSAIHVHAIVVNAIGDRKTEKAVPTLGNILRSKSSLSTLAQKALLKIGSREAAVEVRPIMRTVRQLNDKLSIAKLLAKHGMKDGQSMAIEHLADGGVVSQLCADILQELNDQKTQKQLVEIIKKNPDQKWFIGAMNGLMAMRNEIGITAFEKVISDDRHPLLLQALPLGQLAGKKSLLDHGTKLIESRNDKIAFTFLNQIKTILEKDPFALAYRDERSKNSVSVAFDIDVPRLERKMLISLKKVVSDSYVNAKVRQTAMELLVQFDTKEIEKTLLELVDRADLQGSQTLWLAEKEIRKRVIELK